jgi:tetratricopeptide (TPR) repeat protein/DNA-binding XRE family transcriptional regulator
MRDEPMRPEHLKARMLRGLSGKSQARTAEEIGRSPAQIDQWERGKVEPGEDDLKLLAERTAGITTGDADELFALYETQRQAYQRRSTGIGAVVEDLTEKLARHCEESVRRLLKLPLPEVLPSAKDLHQAAEQFAELKRLSPRSRLVVVKLSPEYQSWALVERCCDAAVEESSRDLKQSAAWARLALAIAKWVRGPEGWQRRLRGYALAHWANLLKVRGDLPIADRRLEEAKRLWHAGSDPAGLLDPGRLFDIEGSLRRDQRRFDEAHSCFDQAIPVSRFPERALINKGFTYEVMGDYEQAIATYLVAKPLVARRGDPRLIYMLHFNIAATCCNMGSYGQAAELLGQVRDQIAARGDRIEMIRLKWLEGRIQVGLGSREEALRLLAEARESFEAEEKFYDVTLALLEEGALLLEENRMQEVKELTRELPKVFASRGVHREALAALQIFQEVVEQEAATVELARRILQFLFRARHDQGLRFTS